MVERFCSGMLHRAAVATALVLLYCVSICGLPNNPVDGDVQGAGDLRENACHRGDQPGDLLFVGNTVARVAKGGNEGLVGLSERLDFLCSASLDGGQDCGVQILQAKAAANVTFAGGRSWEGAWRDRPLGVAWGSEKDIPQDHHHPSPRHTSTPSPRSGSARHRIAVSPGIASPSGGLSVCGGALGTFPGAVVLPPPAAMSRQGPSLLIPTILRPRGGGLGMWWGGDKDPAEENSKKKNDIAAREDMERLRYTPRKQTWWERNRLFKIVRFPHGMAFVRNHPDVAKHEATQLARQEAASELARLLGHRMKHHGGMMQERRGIWGWIKRLLSLGMTLATLQPLVIALVGNVFKLIMLIMRAATGNWPDFEFDGDSGKGPGRDANSTATFADVMGVEEAKHELEDIVAYLKDPGRFTRLGGKMTKGVLLYGPPGTGKTLLARAVAGEAGVPFKYASGSEFEEKYVGVGAKRVRELFSEAKKQAPCIVFLDEVDAIGSTRSLTDQQSLRQTLNQILTELDGFASSEGLIVIAATNFPEVLDKALLRPGRFDRHIEVPNPDVKGREAILKLHAKNVTLNSDANLHLLARGTPGFSGADLANLINKAACKASKDGAADVKMSDFEYAKDLILMGAERTGLSLREENKRLTAYHEGGHALVATHTDGALPVHKATIVPRGHAMGAVMQLPDEDMTSWSRRQMMAEMDVCMAGRVAEELIFGKHNITSGASSDLERATQVAVNMVEKFGMSSKIGFVSHSSKTDRMGRGPRPSEETQAAIDSEVRRFAEESYNRAKKMLNSRKGELHALAEALMEKETLTGDEVREVLAKERQRAGRWLPWVLFGGRRGWGKGGVLEVLDGRMKNLEVQVGELGGMATSLGEIRSALETITSVLPKPADTEKGPPAAA